MLNKSLALVAGACALGFGCTGDHAEGDKREIEDNLIQAGYPASDTQIINGKVYVGGDAEVSLEASREMLERTSGKEQSRTLSLVAGPNPTAICVNGAGLTNPTLSASLNEALLNFNALFGAGSFRLAFFRVTGGPIAGCNFFINTVISSGIGGSSGFPSGGAPFGTISIGDGNPAFGLDFCEHVITHELGHAIGLLHVGFEPIIGCSGGGAPPQPPGISIPGTPSQDSLSIMIPCPRTNVTGEFSQFDVIALNTIY